MRIVDILFQFFILSQNHFLFGDDNNNFTIYTSHCTLEDSALVCEKNIIGIISFHFQLMLRRVDDKSLVLFCAQIYLLYINSPSGLGTVCVIFFFNFVSDIKV